MSERVTRGKVVNVCSKNDFNANISTILPLVAFVILKLVRQVPILSGYGTSILKTNRSKFIFTLTTTNSTAQQSSKKAQVPLLFFKSALDL